MVLSWFSCSVVSESLQSQGLQHKRPPCPAQLKQINIQSPRRKAQTEAERSCSVQLSHSVMSYCLLSPWTAACQASLSITNSQSLLTLMSIELVMPSNHLILCHPLILWPSIFPRIRVFSSELVLCFQWPKYWSFSFSISPFKKIFRNDLPGLIGLISLQSKGLSRVFNTTFQKHQFFGAQPPLWSNSHICK